MKSFKQLIVAGMVFSFTIGGLSQTNPVNNASQPKRDGKVLSPEKPTATDSANATTANLRPARPERPAPSAELQSRIDRFKQDAKAYLEKQQALEKQIKGANDKERAAIREQLKELREQWAERAKEMRKEYKERQAELAEKLTEYRELLDNVRSSALTESGGRPRRGED